MVGVVGVVAAVAWALLVRSPERHNVEGLSCTSRTFSHAAVDFSGAPTWPTPKDALDYALEFDPTIPVDGWELTLRVDEATWERHDGAGHLVGRSVHHRVGSEWGFALPFICEETRVDADG